MVAVPGGRMGQAHERSCPRSFLCTRDRELACLNGAMAAAGGLGAVQAVASLLQQGSDSLNKSAPRPPQDALSMFRASLVR